MLQPVPEQSEGKAMWLAEGRASLSEGRAAKSKLGMCFFSGTARRQPIYRRAK